MEDFDDIMLDAARLAEEHSARHFFELLGTSLNEYIDTHTFNEALHKDVNVAHHWRGRRPHDHLDLSGETIVERMRLGTLDLSGANCAGATLNLEASGSDLRGANLRGTNFQGAWLEKVNFSDADATGADFRWTNLDKANFYQADLTRAKGFYGWGAAENLGTVWGAETAKFSWKVDKLRWSFLRAFGSMPLFGVSYFGIFAIWVVAVTVALLNRVIEAVQNSAVGGAEKLAQQFEKIPQATRLDAFLEWFIQLIQRMSTLDYPPQMGMSLTALMLLAVASTLYRLYCPPEIQENSEVRWTVELSQPRISYRAMDFNRFWRRQIAGICYVIGAPWVLYLLLHRVYEAFVLIFAGTR
jgi:hypothetical protein